MPFPRTPFYSTPSQSILYWQKFLLISATTMVPHRSSTNTSRREQSHHILRQPSSLSHSIDYWQKLLQIFANTLIPHRSTTILTEIPSNPCDHSGPHRSPINTSRRLMMATFSSTSYTDRSFSEVPQAMPFPRTPFYSTPSQSILYWQKFLLISATTMVPHRSSTNTSRREQSHHILRQPSSLSHSIDYWQKLLQIFTNTLIPHRSTTILTEIPSNPCDHDGPHRSPINTSRRLMMATFSSTPYTDRSSSEVPQAMPFPLTPFYPVASKASYTDRSSFWSLRP